MSSNDEINQNSSKESESSITTHLLPDSKLDYDSELKNKILFDKRLTMTDVRIYSLVVQMEINTGMVIYSNRAIADLLEMQVRNVQKSKSKLKDLGYLVYQRRQITIKGKKVKRWCWERAKNNVHFSDDFELEVVKTRTNKPSLVKHKSALAVHPQHALAVHPQHALPVHPVNIYSTTLSCTTLTTTENRCRSLDEKIQNLVTLQTKTHSDHGMGKEKLTEAIKAHIEDRMKTESEDKAINGMKKLIRTQPRGFVPSKLMQEQEMTETNKSAELRMEYQHYAGNFKANQKSGMQKNNKTERLLEPLEWLMIEKHAINREEAIKILRGW